MRLFGFDKFWQLDWQKQENTSIYSCKHNGYTILCDKTIATIPFFKIYKGDIENHNQVTHEIDTDMLILQLRSIKDTGKIAI